MVTSDGCCKTLSRAQKQEGDEFEGCLTGVLIGLKHRKWDCGVIP